MIFHEAQIIGEGTPDPRAPGYEFGMMLCPWLELDGSGQVEGCNGIVTFLNMPVDRRFRYLQVIGTNCMEDVLP